MKHLKPSNSTPATLQSSVIFITITTSKWYNWNKPLASVDHSAALSFYRIEITSTWIVPALLPFVLALFSNVCLLTIVTNVTCFAFPLCSSAYYTKTLFSFHSTRLDFNLKLLRLFNCLMYDIYCQWVQSASVYFTLLYISFDFKKHFPTIHL